ncbi:hypothetical protein ACFFJ7_17400 [Pseudochelatococcus lubricantis]|uniref:hypothetical protein n=1 Tax=Pseudochelatococcus lubricantis TaxID=1538102 RepID=UPI0035E55F06
MSYLERIRHELLDFGDAMLLTKAQRRGLNGRNALLRHMVKTGCTIAGDRLWSDVEIEILRQFRPDLDALALALPERGIGAITKKAHQIGLVPSRRAWSADEVPRLRKPYVAGVPVDDLVSMFPGKTKRQIWNKAFHLGIRRPRRRPKGTGLLLVDTVRNRAFDLGLTMTDLDTYVSAGRYFVCPRCSNWRLLQKAIRELKGQVVVRWPETVAHAA